VYKKAAILMVAFFVLNLMIVVVFAKLV
jgi:hypothetical protein